ncbi:MAG TPA: DUF3800 domain-containing protein [Gemmatirosa sp.]
MHLFNVCLDRPGRRDAQLDAWNRLLNRIDRTCRERNRQENALRRTLISQLQSSAGQQITADVERRLVPYSALALVVADEGHEDEIVRLKRKLAVVNYLPSKFGSWGTSATKNMPLTNFVEDVIFRDSARSYLVQLVDCAAFALLKRETAPTPLVKKYALDRAFDTHLKGVCFHPASPGDPDGIVRK